MPEPLADEVGFDCVKGHFERAMLLEGDARSTYLVSACESDRIRSRVEQMLAAHEAGDSWLGLLTGIALNDAIEPPLEDAAVPDRIGRYKIVRRIAVGGMGVVYEGLQHSPRRSVAVKVMGYQVQSESTARRFRQEIEILGRLRHPAIAQIFDADIDGRGSEGVAYFVMEFVPGARSLIEYARSHELSQRDRLQLFVRVCEGVHHGHQKGVIHRDLKPDNILIDETGNPKIIDFGIARLTGVDVARMTILAEGSDIAGTLQYMSPEQLDLDTSDIDTRCDVYSLGSVLYELLAGAPPYDLRDMPIGKALSTLREGTVPRLAERASDVSRDLARIVHKALDGDREQRYQSAIELATDLHRFLRGEPILAHAPSTWYLLRLAARRHRAAVIALGALSLGLVAAAIVSLSFGVEATRAQARAEHELARAVSAEAFFAEALRSVRQLRLGQVVPYTDVLDNASEMLEQGAFADQPLTEISVRRALAAACTSQMRHADAEVHVRRAIDLCMQQYGPDGRPTIEARNQLLAVLYKRYQTAYYQGKPRWEWSLEHYERARRAFGRDDQLTYDTLVHFAVATQPALSAEIWHEWWQTEVRLHGADSDQTQWPRFGYGGALAGSGRFQEGLPLLLDALSHYERLPAEPAALDWQVEGTRIILSCTYHDLGLIPEALEIIEPRAYPEFGEIFRSEPLWAIHLHAAALAKLGRLDEAEAQARPALERSYEFLGDHRTTQLLAGTLIDVLRESGRIDEARTVAEEIRQVGSVYEPEAMRSLARLALDSGEQRQAVDLARDALVNVHDVPEVRNTPAAYARLVLAEALVGVGDHDAAREPLERAIATMVATCSPAHPDLAKAYRLRGAISAVRADDASAEAALREALALDLEWRGDDARATAKSRLALGRFLSGAQRVDEARSQFDEAERIFRSSPFEEGLWLPQVIEAHAALPPGRS